MLITGIIGTPVHELSHALMCLVFGHRITEIKLYTPNSNDGTLGYVSHSYRGRNLYHRVGSFFIGIAPIVCGCGVLFLLMRLMVPDAFDLVWDAFGDLPNASDSFLGYFEGFGAILTAVFDPDHFSNPLWWLFLLLALMIAGHMELSGADMKGGLNGFLFLAGLIFLLDTLLFFLFPKALEALTAAMTSFGLYIASFLSISIVFLLVMILIALLIKGLILIIKH